MKKALVFGGARSGNAIVKLLLRQGYHVIWADDKSLNIDEDINLDHVTVYENGIPLTLRDIKVDIVVKNPGIPDFHPVVAWLVNRYFIYNEIDVAYLEAKQFAYGAITGTNGKTTTTALLHHLLSGEEKPNYVAGNIGLPLSEIVYNHGKESANIALELSSFQLDGLLFFRPKVMTILNLSPDHLDRYLALNRYYDSKFRLVHSLDESSIFLRNIDDEEIMKRARYLNCQIIDFSLTQQADLHLKDDHVYYKDMFLFDTKSLQIKGPHNVANAMVAAMMASILGVDWESIRTRLKSFTGVEHRLEIVASVNDILFVNDSKATNPDATLTALRSFKQPTLLLLGGFDKKIAYDDLKSELTHVKKIIAFGQTKELIANTFDDVLVTDNLEEAFKVATEIGQAGDVILLSPSSASFDQYPNFEARGDHFKKLVQEYAQAVIE